ncbi:RHS repeat-associated core domain-containing protein [Chromobacterium sp. CV08]|uniref:RHS repeat-associated core domain-containing protein n=1 Tax=Chromobacterium sp. CV08 TaxID=3133274 RepID=UPI003DA82F81
MRRLSLIYYVRKGKSMENGVLGFNGERRDTFSGAVHLGNGYRAYSPALMRFRCPDSLSPFGAGGVNAYAYCAGDPVNRADPSGHLSWQAWAGIGLGVAGLALAAVTAGTSIAASGGIIAALQSASAVSLAIGAAAVVADAAAIASGALEEYDPKASAILGWISLGAGAAGAGVGAAQAAGRVAAGLKRLQSHIAPLLKNGLSGRGPAWHPSISPLDGVNPHNFSLLGQSPGFPWGVPGIWLDYSFYDHADNELRLTLAVHGTSSRVARLLVADAGDEGFTVTQALAWLRNKNYPLDSGVIKRVRFLMCDSATNGYGSFAAKFAEKSGITTTGWRGRLVIGGPLDVLITNMDVEFPGNRLFTEGVANHFVENVGRSSELLQITEGVPVTYRPISPGILEEHIGAYY